MVRRTIRKFIVKWDIDGQQSFRSRQGAVKKTKRLRKMKLFPVRMTQVKTRRVRR